MKEIKLEGIIYKIKLVNQLTMIFHKVNLAKQSVDLIQCMNDCLVTYIEKDIFKTIECKEIMQRFQNMKNRREQLSKLS